MAGKTVTYGEADAYGDDTAAEAYVGEKGGGGGVTPPTTVDVCHQSTTDQQA